MKLLCVIDSLGSGGAQRQLVEMGIAFKKNNYEVNFLVYQDIPFYEDRLKAANIPVTKIVERNYFKRVVRMYTFMRNNDFNIVISFLETPSFIAELSTFPTKKWKLIVGERSAKPKIYKSPKLLFYRLFHLRADYIVANSHQNINILKKVNPFIPAKKYKVIYNSFDFEKWNNEGLHANENKIGLPLTIAVAASIYPVKNLESLIIALSMLDKKEKEMIKINWYGKGNNEDNQYFVECLALIKKHKVEENIQFWGETKNVIAAMKQADFVGLFSLYEGLPNAICEGMAIGKPILAPSISDLPIIINEENGVLFNPNSVEEISNALKYIITLPKQKIKEMGMNSRKKALFYFDKKKIIQQYIDLF
ncbi:N-acetylgalactosamine-N,N'-diacetylbacillosaminyl-diphospho-undecaprenol 4-alpha-N-acetylgalactosaminyltransferase [Mycovorax composti]|jgi:Glycosyltransferase|uniref:N-acetylgalactosamine-N, N'-diacetylbacillosaminyl-diphospho-undecaprenol 4-alpha-N-acetylgalactosaminyltransferase n=1 Tax=Mycovorax composti TaxID=2962693 RepID=A0ABZ2EKC3_9BACT